MDQKKIGKYIANKRRTKNLTQAQLAELLGIGPKSVSKWERGVCLPDVSKYQELCDILEVSLNELFAGEDLSLDEIVLKSENTLKEISVSVKKEKRKLKVAILIICLLLVVGIVINFEFTPGAGFKASEEALQLYEMSLTEEGTYQYILDQIDKEYNVVNTEEIAQTIIITVDARNYNIENDQYYSALLIATTGPEIESVIWKSLEQSGYSTWQYDVASFRYAFGKTWRTEDIRDYGNSAKGIQELIVRFKRNP